MTSFTTSDDPVILRASLIPTTAYVASSPQRIKGWNQLVVVMDLTLGSLTSAQMQVEMASPSGNATPAAGDWYAYTARAAADPTVSAGLAPIAVGRAAFSFSLTDRYAIPLDRVVGKWIRVQVKGTGTLTNSLIAVSMVEGKA
jgi:hypothetical protein